MSLEYRELINYFDEIAGNFRTDSEGIHRAERILADVLKLAKVEIILDVGCGNGFLFPILRKYAKVVIGVDISRGMLKLARRAGDVVNCTAEVLPLKDKSVDVVLNYCVLPHIKHRRGAYREYLRVLRPGGVVYVVHPEGRERTNLIHREIGWPVESDLLPDGSVLAMEFTESGFVVTNCVDSEDLFLLEAKKFPEKLSF